MKKLFSLVGYITIDGLKKAEKNISDFERNVRKAIRPIDRFGKQVAGVGKSMTKTLTVPLALAGGAILKFGADFEKAMTNSLAIMGKDADAMRDKMGKTARDISKTSTFSAKQAAEAYYFLASAGMTAAESMEALPRVAKFAQAGNFDLALATDLLTDAQSALGLKSDDTAESMRNMTRVSDVLVKANTIANASVQQFSESLTNRAGAALRLLKKDVTEGAAILAVYADQGRKGAEAGTALDIVLRDLQKASINNEKAFKNANIAVYDANGKMNNMADIIRDLEERFEGMSDKQKRAELMTLGFTEKSISATLALIGSSDAIAEYEKKLKSAAGITEEVAEKQLKSLWAQLTIVKNKLIDVAIEFSETLIPIVTEEVMPMIEKFIGKLTKLANWFSSLPKDVKRNVIQFAAFVAITGPMLILIGKLISSVRLVTTALTAAKLAMIAFNTVLISNPFGLLVLGIVAVTGAIIGLRSEYKRLKEAHKEWSVMTTDQAAREAFIGGVGQVVKKIKTLGDALKDTAILEKEMGEEIGVLVGKAQEMGFTIKGDLVYQLKALSIIQGQLMGSYDTTKKRSMEFIQNKKEEAEVIKDAAGATKADISAKDEWASKLAMQGKEGIELINAQRDAAVAKAKEDKENAKTIAMIEEYYQGEKAKYWEEELVAITKIVDANKKAALEKRQAEIDYLDSIKIASAAANGENLKALEMQIEAEKKAAEKSLTIKEEIDEAKRLIDEKYYDDLEKLREEELSKETAFGEVIKALDGFFKDERVQLAFQMFDMFRQMRAMNLQNQMDSIDIEKEKQIELVKKTVKDKAQQEKEIEKINETADTKKKELMLKQAKRDKAAAIFQAAIAAIQLAISGFKTQPFMPLGIIMGAIATALGIGLVAAIASKPLPALAEGGVVPQTPGGRLIRAGEGDDAEAILPMRKGSAEIAQNILEKIGGIFLPDASSSSRPAYAPSGGSRRMSRPMRPIQHIWKIGTLVADDNGIKELERRQLNFRVSEEQRKGDN